MDKEELRKQGRLKKAVIFDCDNTLWAGVLGEDTITPDLGIQEEAVFLSKHGIIVGLCSKNNEDDVNDILPSQVLTDEYLAIKRINWRDKVENLRDIAEELNIGLDAIVFVDDSDFEIHSIRERLPEVLAIYPHELMAIVAQWFDLRGDFTKTQQYKEQLVRAREQAKYPDMESFLASLEIIVTMHINNPSHIQRISELTRKTNQFNLTTRRYSDDDIRKFMYDGIVFSAEVGDKFGDSEITAVVIVMNDRIDTFLMSCRIIGRNIHFSIMDYVVGFLTRFCEVSKLIVEYVPTPKNKLVSMFYDEFDSKLIEVTRDHKLYQINLEDYVNKGRDYICVKG